MNADVLRGSGQPIHPAVATALGVSPGQLRTFTSPHGSVGANIDHWVMSPATAEALSKIKKQTGSNEALLQLVADGIQVAGIPILTDPNVDAATFAWGIDSTWTKSVLRKGTEVKQFDAVSVDRHRHSRYSPRGVCVPASTVGGAPL